MRHLGSSTEPSQIIPNFGQITMHSFKKRLVSEYHFTIQRLVYHRLLDVDKWHRQDRSIMAKKHGN